MGKYLDKFKNKFKQVESNIEDKYNGNVGNNTNDFGDFNDFNDFNKDVKDYDDVGIIPAQRPESFYHFILENQYKDLERSIRGFKDVFDRKTNQWMIIRKEEHCFTDEEAEEILRTAQGHLATDIKLSFIPRETFPILMDTIFEEISFLFRSIAEYRYGRYGTYEKQYNMKLQNQKILLELFTRIQANYSRAISGMENKYTHDSVRGQESLSQSDRDYSGIRSGYT